MHRSVSRYPPDKMMLQHPQNLNRALRPTGRGGALSKSIPSIRTGVLAMSNTPNVDTYHWDTVYSASYDVVNAADRKSVV